MSAFPLCVYQQKCKNCIDCHSELYFDLFTFKIRLFSLHKRSAWFNLNCTQLQEQVIPKQETSHAQISALVNTKQFLCHTCLIILTQERDPIKMQRFKNLHHVYYELHHG